MEGPKKQEDKLNIVWIFAFTLMGGAFIYATFVGLQALYLDEAVALREAREADGKRDAFNALRAKQALTEYKKVTDKDGKTRLHIPLTRAMELVVQDVRKGNPSNLVSAVGPSDKPTVPAVFGRPPDGVQMPAPKPVPTPGDEGGDDSVEAPPEGPEGPAPGTETPAPGTETPAPGTETPAPGTETPAPGTGTPAPRPGGAAGAPSPRPAAPAPGTPAPRPAPAQPAGGNANP